MLQQEARALSAAGPHVLRLAPGRHQLLRPLELSATHSGLHFVGSAEGASVISGGFEIPPASWVEHAGAACAGCGAIMRAPLAAGTNYSRQLFVRQIRIIILFGPISSNPPQTLSMYVVSVLPMLIRIAHADREPIGAWNPMVCPTWGPPASGQQCPGELDLGTVPASRGQDWGHRLLRRERVRHFPAQFPPF